MSFEDFSETLRKLVACAYLPSETIFVVLVDFPQMKHRAKKEPPVGVLPVSAIVCTGCEGVLVHSLRLTVLPCPPPGTCSRATQTTLVCRVYPSHLCTLVARVDSWIPAFSDRGCLHPPAAFVVSMCSGDLRRGLRLHQLGEYGS